MNNPLFSILIANYNNGKYLMDAIESVRQQTYTHWEIILVDDGSTDNSHILYKELAKDERIHIYYNEENKGCGYTKRRCVELAIGEFCGFLDPDDTLDYNALQVMFETIREHPECGAFFSHMYVCDSEMKVIYNDTFSFGSEAWNKFIHFQRGIPLYCFNRGVYLSTRGIHPALTQSVDIDLYYLMSEQTKVFYIDKPLYYYRNNPISLTKNTDIATGTHLWVIMDSLKRQNAPLQETVKEIADFYTWRIEPLRKELNITKQDRFYQWGLHIRHWKRQLKSLLNR
ncbi:MAG: glycosyltransferase [Paludibacter sp.]|nr:glycosyltransferase [Bacteroidales bacterium]MCM1069084.1 glycosyltransferase [Prevotella sp.]MCM1353523.1 glycosyltransferase [Bacteroides sp.]MCM1442684.1 glycosyltransferase [Muribaculum sp.]MCM1481680.1 glycosyltransferase [Paludibacter sp.]